MAGEFQIGIGFELSENDISRYLDKAKKKRITLYGYPFDGWFYATINGKKIFERAKKDPRLPRQDHTGFRGSPLLYVRWLLEHFPQYTNPEQSLSHPLKTIEDFNSKGTILENFTEKEFYRWQDDHQLASLDGHAPFMIFQRNGHEIEMYWRLGDDHKYPSGIEKISYDIFRQELTRTSMRAVESLNKIPSLRGRRSFREFQKYAHSL